MAFVDENISPSALKIAEMFGYHISKFPKEWFEEKQAYRLRNAAERYLSKWAKEEDIPFLKQIREEKTGQQATNLDCIIIIAMFRKSQTLGLEELSSRNPEQLSPGLHDLLQGLVRSVSSDLLRQLARLKADSIRLASVTELARRDALGEELAEELSGDSFVNVRLEAIKVLSDKGIDVSESKAKEALIVRPTRGGLGLGLGGRNYAEDTSKYDDYSRYLLSRKSLAELREIDERDGPFDAEALLVAGQVFPEKAGDQLRSALKEGFHDRFESRLERMEATDSLVTLVERMRDLKKFVCLKHTRRALDVVAGQLKRQDLALVQEVVDRWEIDSSEQVLKYLARFGGWEDVKRILELKTVHGGGLMSGVSAFNTDIQLVGETLCRLGQGRVVDLLDAIQSGSTLIAVIRACTHKVFSGLGDDKLIDLLNMEDEDIRKVVALKCLLVLSKTRIRILLERYAAQKGYRYYNVIHWLDLGVTMPKTYVRKIVQWELQA